MSSPTSFQPRDTSLHLASAHFKKKEFTCRVWRADLAVKNTGYFLMFFIFYFFSFMHMSILPVWIYVYHSCALNRGRSEVDGCQYPVTGVVDACEPPCGRWELTWGRWKGRAITPAPSTSFVSADQGSVPSSHIKIPTTAWNSRLSRTLHTCDAWQRSKQNTNIHKLKIKNKKPHSQIGFGRKWDHSGSRSWR